MNKLILALNKFSGLFENAMAKLNQSNIKFDFTGTSTKMMSNWTVQIIFFLILNLKIYSELFEINITYSQSCIQQLPFGPKTSGRC